MQKLILMSVMIATFVAPAVLARRGQTGYGSLFGLFAALVAIYVVLLLFVYPRLF